MPILALTDNPRDNAHILLATMQFPKDSDRREQLLTQIRIAETDAAVDDLVPLSIAKVLLYAPPFTSDHIDPKNEAFGWIAGNMLIYIATMESNGVTASKRKAQNLLSDRLFGCKTFEGKGVSYSGKSLENNWYQFRSVVHLWAAWNCFLTDELSCIDGDWSPFMDGRKPPEEAFRCFTKDNLPEFLALSEWFRHFGETHNPPRQRYGPTLRKDEAWCAPPTYDLPELKVSLEMPSWMRVALKDYKARS